jgi:hypothetical protein
MTLTEMVHTAVYRIHEAIGDCEIIKESSFGGTPSIWRQIDFKREKFTETVNKLIEDIKKQKIFYFTVLPNPKIFEWDSQVAQGWGISVRIIEASRFDIKRGEVIKELSIDYKGWPK